MAILTVTLNPALDLTTEVDKVESGPKLRCGPPRFDPGGGGVNVTRAISKLGGQSTAFIAVGGVFGQMFRSLLEGEGHSAEWFETGGLTRQSIVVNETATTAQYRFVLPGPEWSAREQEAMPEALERVLKGRGGRFSHMVASGSLPAGLPDDYYHRIGELAESAGAHFVLDTSGRMLDAAASGGRYPPYIWVMDQAEAEHLAGQPLAGLDALERFGSELQRRKLAQILVLTFAEGGAVALTEGETHRFVPPKVEVSSKVGAGDSFVAGLVLKLSGGADLREALAYAVASATSAVTTPATELCDGPLTERLFEMILNRNS
jgi:6-phosphofructokinase 2